MKLVKGVQKTGHCGGLLGERMTQDFQRLEETVAKMRANAEALNKDIAPQFITMLLIIQHAR